MLFIELIVFPVIIFLIFYLFERIIRKSFNIEKKKGWYKQVNLVHKWGERILVIVALVFIFLLTVFSKPIPPFFLFGYLIVLSSFRAFMEWKYEKALKQYFVTINYLILFIVLLITIEVFFN